MAEIAVVVDPVATAEGDELVAGVPMFIPIKASAYRLDAVLKVVVAMPVAS